MEDKVVFIFALYLIIVVVVRRPHESIVAYFQKCELRAEILGRELFYYMFSVRAVAVELNDCGVRSSGYKTRSLPQTAVKRAPLPSVDIRFVSRPSVDSAVDDKLYRRRVVDFFKVASCVGIGSRPLDSITSYVKTVQSIGYADMVGNPVDNDLRIAPSRVILGYFCHDKTVLGMRHRKIIYVRVLAEFAPRPAVLDTRYLLFIVLVHSCRLAWIPFVGIDFYFKVDIFTRYGLVIAIADNSPN